MKLVLWAAALVLLAGHAAQGAERSAERAQVAAERQRLEAQYSAEEARCRERFAVSSCVDEVRKRRRQALAGVRQRELALDDAERRQRAAERQEAVARKQAELAARPVPAEGPRHAPVGPTPGASGVPHEPRTPRTDADAREAQRRAQASQQRREESQAQRDRIAARQAQRASHGKAVQPLPMPPEVAASAKPR